MLTALHGAGTYFASALERMWLVTRRVLRPADPLFQVLAWPIEAWERRDRERNRVANLALADRLESAGFTDAAERLRGMYR